MNKKRVSAESAVYLELANAIKDSDCQVVNVPGGVSADRGCCDLWSASSEDAGNFSCGSCEYLEGASEEPEEERPLGKKEASKMSDRQILDSDRPVKEKNARSFQ